MSPHTAKRMKTEALLTKISDRDQRNIWEKKGSLDTQAHAVQRANEILAKSSSAIFPPEVETRIRAEFPDLVPGVLEMPK